MQYEKYTCIRAFTLKDALSLKKRLGWLGVILGQKTIRSQYQDKYKRYNLEIYDRVDLVMYLLH